MKTNCPACQGKKSVSEGPYQGKWYRKCHRCSWIHSEDWAPALHAPRGGRSGPVQLRPTESGEGSPTSSQLAWLGKYGVSFSAFQRTGGTLSQGRLCFTCTSFRALRSTDPHVKPKWLTEIRKPLGASRIDEWGWGQGNTLVIVEDSLAALKASLAGLRGFPLLGTNVRALSPSRFAGYKVRVLTDPDEAGRIAGRKLAWALRGLDVKVINGKEPKEYTLEELRALCS